MWWLSVVMCGSNREPPVESSQPSNVFVMVNGSNESYQQYRYSCVQLRPRKYYVILSQYGVGGIAPSACEVASQGAVGGFSRLGLCSDVIVRLSGKSLAEGPKVPVHVWEGRYFGVRMGMMEFIRGI